MGNEAQTPLLEFRDVRTHYGRIEILKSVNYKIYPGEIVCLLGGNASGKSTTMKAILGIVTDLTRVPALHRELALLKVKAKPTQRGEVFQVADVFRAKVLDVGSDTMVMEVTGSADKIDAFAQLMLPYSVMEIARSGRISIERGKKVSPKVKGRGNGKD